MNEDLDCGLGCLLALGCLVVLFLLGTKVGKIRCPKCEHLVQAKEIRTELIPRTKKRIERQISPDFGPTTGMRTYESRLYAEYRVFYGCPDCGYEWEKTDKREVPDAKIEYIRR